MTLTLNLTADQEACLSAEARELGVTEEEYAVTKIFAPLSGKYMLLTNTPSAVDNRTQREKDDEFERFQAWLRVNTPIDQPDIPLKYLSREEIYAGRGEIDQDAPEDPVAVFEDWVRAVGGNKSPAIPLEALSREVLYQRTDDE
jgi:hypothetical protein